MLGHARLNVKLALQVDKLEPSFLKENPALQSFTKASCRESIREFGNVDLPKHVLQFL